MLTVLCPWDLLCVQHLTHNPPTTLSCTNGKVRVRGALSWGGELRAMAQSRATDLGIS